MQQFAPALEDLLEHLEEFDRRLRPVDAGEGAVPAGDLLLQRSDLAEIYDLVDALIAGIRSVDAAHRRYRDRFLRLPAGCLCTGSDGIILEANRAAGALFDLAPDRLKGTPLHERFHPMCIPAFRSTVATLLRGEEAPVQEFSLAKPDGGTFPVAVAVSVTHDSGDGAAGLLWIVIAAPGRKKVEEALRRSEEECRAVVESQTELICRWLPDGTITFANDAYCRNVGIPCEDLLGRRYVPTVPPDDLARIRQNQASLTPDHPAVTVEHRVVLPEGGVRWQQWTDTAFFDEEGSVVEYQSVGRDITEARMAREALLLANRKLNLLSDVTRHDILNLLNVLSGYLGLSRELTDDPELHGYFEKEEEAVHGIQRCMVFTGEYQGIGMASPVWQPLSRIVDAAMAGLDMGEVAVEVQADDLQVYADPLVARVFANLIDNSLRHGGGVTRIRIRPEASARGVSIVYEDDGVGIPHAEKEKLFERGFGRKTGFGLFLAREILAITEISIRETGQAGKGARFEIGIPPGFYRITGRGRAP